MRDSFAIQIRTPPKLRSHLPADGGERSLLERPAFVHALSHSEHIFRSVEPQLLATAEYLGLLALVDLFFGLRRSN